MHCHKHEPYSFLIIDKILQTCMCVCVCFRSACLYVNYDRVCLFFQRQKMCNKIEQTATVKMMVKCLQFSARVEKVYLCLHDKEKWRTIKRRRGQQKKTEHRHDKTNVWKFLLMLLGACDIWLYSVQYILIHVYRTHAKISFSSAFIYFRHDIFSLLCFPLERLCWIGCCCFFPFLGLISTTYCFRFIWVVVFEFLTSTMFSFQLSLHRRSNLTDDHY